MGLLQEEAGWAGAPVGCKEPGSAVPRAQTGCSACRQLPVRLRGLMALGERNTVVRKETCNCHRRAAAFP